MALFDKKVFNGDVFAKYVDNVPNLSRNELLKSGAVVEKAQYAAMLPDQVGGNYITLPIKARIAGVADNYDGATNIGSESRKTYAQGRIVVGRARGWTEKDFSSDVTGEDFMPAVNEVAEYWDDVDQATLLATLKGVFAMTGGENKKFVDAHTYDISGVKNSPTGTGENVFTATTLNNAMQKALGDNKAKFRLAIMHSQVATNLENLQLLEYMKYTDDDGIERDLGLATLNGRTVLIDDNMPVEQKSDDNTYNAYTTYVLGDGAIEYTNCGAKVPYEMDRDPKTNGGETTMYSRQRKIFSPYGISFKAGSIVSPTDTQLSTGTNWEVAHSSTDYFPAKAIPIARIITRG